MKIQASVSDPLNMGTSSLWYFSGSTKTEEVLVGLLGLTMCNSILTLFTTLI